MKQFLLVIFLAIASLPGYAQLGNETNEEEKDAIAKGESSQSKYNPLSQNWIGWEIGDQSKWRRFDINVPSSQTQQMGGVQLHNEKPGGYSSNGYSKSYEAKKTQINKMHKADMARNNARMALWKDELNRRAEEHRRKIDAQNARDREQGRRDYYARMGGFHAYNAARDQWMATEGVRILEEYHATDMASVPERKPVEHSMNIMDGNELADLLKDKKEENDISIIVEFVETNTQRENKSGLEIGSSNKYVDFYGDGGYKESDIDDWETAISQKPFVSSDSKRDISMEYDKIILLRKKDMNLEGLSLTTLPNLGCVILLGDSVLMLDSPDMTMLQWGVGAKDFSEVVTCGTRTFAKQGNYVVEIKDKELATLFETETYDFSIYNETDSTFILCANIVNLAIVTRMHVDAMKYDELLRVPMFIDKIVSNGRVFFAQQGNNIIDMSNNMPTLLYTCKTTLNDFCMCQDGLLVATDKKVMLLKSQGEVFTLSGKGAKHIWCDGTDIYLLDNDLNLIKYSKKQ